MNRALSILLRAGLLIAVAMIGVGFFLWIGHGTYHGVFQSGNSLDLQSLCDGSAVFSFSSLNNQRPESLIVLGLIFLILLPYLRISLVAVLFFLEKDFLYCSISILVMLILMVGAVIS